MFAVLIHGIMQLIVLGKVGKTIATIKWGCPKYQVYGFKKTKRGCTVLGLSVLLQYI